jgi:hypothetical protein
MAQKAKPVRTAGIVIPTWNGRELLRACLQALRRQSFPDFHTCVVDNGSTDGTREMLAEDFPEVKLIALPRNFGFARAVNEGIRAGAEPLVGVLNNDVVPEPGWLEALVRRAQSAPEETQWTSALLWARQPDRVESAGLGIRRDGTPVIPWRDQPLSALPSEPTEVFGAYGGAALLRRSMLDRIGLFDERFVSFGEDVDLALRARLAGYRCLLVPSARGVHRHRATADRIPNRVAYLEYRNTVLYLVKNMPLGFLARRLPRFALTGLRPLLKAPWRGLGWALVAARFGILWNIPYALRARRRAGAPQRDRIREWLC